jgi:osmotically-inducible protein OsmY
MRTRMIFLCPTIVAFLLLIFSGCAIVTEKKADEPVGDSSILSTIKARIASDPDLSSQKITVVAKHRDVVLSGVVPSRELKFRLIKLALGVKGVKSVEDKITVRKR